MGMTFGKYNLLIVVSLVFVFLFGCQKDETPANLRLKFADWLPIAVPEASGLSLYKDGFFLAVSDSTSQVYVINMQGLVVKKLNYTGKNLEGVAYAPAHECIFVVEEKTSEVVRLDTNGLELSRFGLPLNNEDPQHGLEGISYNPGNDHLYIISEKAPALLFETDLQGNVLSTNALDFAKDYSSVYYEASTQALWILSDDSESLTRTNLTGVPVQTWDHSIKKGEGVIVNSDSATVYIITDRESAIFKLSF